MPGGGGGMPGGVVCGGQRKTWASIIDMSSMGKDNSAVSPPAFTTLRRRSLTESSRTNPTRVQPTGTRGSVVSRTRPMAARSSWPHADDAVARMPSTATTAEIFMPVLYSEPSARR